MSLPTFDPVQFTATSPAELARQGNALSERVANYLRRLTSNRRLDSVVLDGVALVTLTNNVVNHKLGRQPVGWALLDDTGGGIVRIAWSATTITLYSPSTCTVQLEVW
jgi:hypothetical protein